MDSIWHSADLSEVIIKDQEILKQTQNIVTDITRGQTNITNIVENMAGVLTHPEPENREKGMKFFNKILKDIPKDYLNDSQIKFISKFYCDRLKDHHRVVPSVLEGYICIIEMENYEVQNSAEFFTLLFREVACQSQVRQDRFNIYTILKKIMVKDPNYMKTLGPDFLYGVISLVDGERDPRNLLFLFNFLPHFVSIMPLGHLVSEMFEVISCYYPVDFHPSPDDPAAVTRQQLADALAPCLCACSEFAEECLVLLVEKLDSSLRLAKLDSLNLLKESTKTFSASSYGPFLKTLWSSLYRDMTNKTDDEIRLAAHNAHSALVTALSNDNSDNSLQLFIKGILISSQTAIAEATTVAHFAQTKMILLTTANASKESYELVAKSMVPALMAYYEMSKATKFKIASLVFLGDLYDIGVKFDSTDNFLTLPDLCLQVVSGTDKDLELAGYNTMLKIVKQVNINLVEPLVELLIHNIQHSTNNEVLIVCISIVHALACQFPELIMNVVVKGKCDIDNLTRDKVTIEKRLQLLCNLASIDDFTKVIITEMLNVIVSDNASLAVEALNVSISDTKLYTDYKLTQIESDHGLIDSIISWLKREIYNNVKIEVLSHGLKLIGTTISNLPIEKQELLLRKHSLELFDMSNQNENYYLILQALYSPISLSVDLGHVDELIRLSVKIALLNENEVLRTSACILIAHLVNKVDHGVKFEKLYEVLTNKFASCQNYDVEICSKLIVLYGWLCKALILRGSNLFLFWLKKITVSISNADYCQNGAESIKLIMSDSDDYLSIKQHCRVSLLYKQRLFQSFLSLVENFDTSNDNVKKAYFLSCAYILEKLPRSVLLSKVDVVAPLVISSLDLDSKELLLVMLEVLSHLVKLTHRSVADSLQSIVPRFIALTSYNKSMEVRIKCLQCVCDLANTYPTALLLPYKQEVLIGLAPSLDDKKRLVRSAAVRARTRWFLVGSPGENKDN